MKKKIAIIHPEIKGGGGEAILSWTIEALKNDFDLSLITIDQFSTLFMNQLYKTNIVKDEICVYRVFPLLSLIPKRLFQLKRHLVMLYCKNVIQDYDLFLSTQNEMDFGVRGIQYIHFPVSFTKSDDIQINKFTIPALFHLHRIYAFFCTLLSRYNEFSVRNNVTVVNSNWTGKVVSNVYNIESNVVYPPVLSDITPEPWKSRKLGFVCVGWIRPEKRIELIIEIISIIRHSGYDVDLHIVGPVWDKKYYKKILRLYETNRKWLHLEGMLARKDLVHLITHQKFGIHGYENEHFGMAVAEMAKAGCIVFVPDGGGQKEIVNFDKRVIFKNKDDAVEKIIDILQDVHAQEILSKKMWLLGSRYSPELFMKCIKKTVNDFSKI